MARMTKNQAYHILQDKGAGFVANVVLTRQKKPASKLVKLAKLAQADYIPNFSSFSTDYLLIGGYHCPWDTIDKTPASKILDLPKKLEAASYNEPQLTKEELIVKKGTCPKCQQPLKRNLALTGWWQCSQLGAKTHITDPNLPSCDFQTFI